MNIDEICKVIQESLPEDITERKEFIEKLYDRWWSHRLVNTWRCKHPKAVKIKRGETPWFDCVCPDCGAIWASD